MPIFEEDIYPDSENAFEGCDGDYAGYEEAFDDMDEPREDNFRDDVEADADTLASAGYGTDEDYGGYEDDSHLAYYDE